jgi:hypothetical protein
MPSAEIVPESVRLLRVSAGAAISQLRRSTWAFCTMQGEGMPRVEGPRNPNDAQPFAALQSLGCGGQCNHSGAAHSFHVRWKDAPDEPFLRSNRAAGHLRTEAPSPIPRKRILPREESPSSLRKMLGRRYPRRARSRW